MAARVPPQSLEAEQSILGGLMLEKEAFDQVADIIEPNDFYSPANQKIYSVIHELHSKNKPIDLVTVTDILQSKQEFDQIGGYTYLASLLEKTISAAHVHTYAQIVKEKSLLRRLIHTSTEIIERAFKGEQEVDFILDQAESEIFKVGEKKSSQGLVGSMEIVKESIKKIESLYQRKEDITGLSTGFAELDKMLAGLHGGELTIIAARPSMGKTAFSLNIAGHVALRLKKSVAYFSLEMGKESVMMRLLASEAKVSMSEIRTGRVQDSSWPKLIAAASTLSESPLYIDDTSGISPFEIRARCRRLKAQNNLDLIVIDYLQLMDLKLKVESRERAVSEISKNLKTIAKELNVPVVALAQLNRGVEGRSDRRPMLSDLRESGSIEQDADVIGMLYRDDYYDKDDPEKQGHAEIIIGKQRNGPTGTVKLFFDAKTNRFRDADPHNVSPLPPPQAPPSYPGKPRNFAPGGNA
jgi:replicative DNA helicase